MSARAWKARKDGAYSDQAKADRRDATPCRRRGCILNRRRHAVHFNVLTMEHIPDFAYGTNRMGRRKARKQGLVKP